MGKTAHAYLFSGPRGIGKTTVARLLAKALNCENRKEKSSEPCNNCASCNEISGSRAIDVIEIDAASHTGVDNVRENIIENAQFRPTKSPYKIFIIDEAHMLSTSAFNALLKTLEEPPAHVVFVLATTQLRKLPETIISRCQRFNFKKVSHDELKKHLLGIAKEEKVKVDKEVIGRIVNKSEGCVRDAVSLLDQIMAVGEKNITAEIASVVLPASNLDEALKFVCALISRQAKECLDLISREAGEGARFVIFADDIIEMLRIMMIMKATSQKNVSGIDLGDTVKKELQKLGDLIEYQNIVHLIDLIMKRRQEIESAPLPQLPMELAVIEWCLDDTCQKLPAEKQTDNQQKNAPQQDNSATSQFSQEATAEKIKGMNPIPQCGTGLLFRSKLREIKPPSCPAQPTGVDGFNTEKDENTSQPTAKRITEKIKNLVVRDKEPVCSIDDVQNKWPELLNKINGDSPSLTFILKMVNIIAINGNTVQMSVGYSFHKDKLECKKCRKQIEELLSKLLDKKVHIDIIVKEKSETEANSKELEELATAIGGEVVN